MFPLLHKLMVCGSSSPRGRFKSVKAVGVNFDKVSHRGVSHTHHYKPENGLALAFQVLRPDRRANRREA